MSYISCSINRHPLSLVCKFNVPPTDYRQIYSVYFPVDIKWSEIAQQASKGSWPGISNDKTMRVRSDMIGSEVLVLFQTDHVVLKL